MIENPAKCCQFDTVPDLFEQLRARKIRMSTMDLRIACIAIINDRILLTRNFRDFEKVPELRLENWTQDTVIWGADRDYLRRRGVQILMMSARCSVADPMNRFMTNADAPNLSIRATIE
jgi:hypothetical protein